MLLQRGTFLTTATTTTAAAATAATTATTTATTTTATTTATTATATTYGYYYYDDDVIWYAHIQVDPDKPQPKLRGHLEGTLYQCKGCAFRGSKPHYCQTHWFQMIFVGWLIMLGRGGSLSMQELCFQ